jgi:phosphopantetheinyl transferase
VGVWHIEEDPSFFYENLALSMREQLVVSGLQPRKRIQWLASRYLLDLLVEHHERLETSSLETGKPILVDRIEEISLSHSEEYVAAMTGLLPVGVDIQKCKPKILELEHKFARPSESAIIDRRNPMLHLHILWGAKEVLYKIYSLRRLNFLSHLSVELPEVVHEHGVFTGSIENGAISIPCNLEYRIMSDYVLVFGSKMN